MKEFEGNIESLKYTMRRAENESNLNDMFKRLTDSKVPLIVSHDKPKKKRKNER